MTAVVTDAMVDRGADVIGAIDLDKSGDWMRDLARAVITAALTDPRMCKGCTASLADMRVDAQWCSPACKVRTERRRKAEQTPDPPPRRPGGLQVAFGPARAAVAAEFAKHGLTYPKARATMVLRRALSRKQRAKFDARTRPGLAPDTEPDV